MCIRDSQRSLRRGLLRDRGAGAAVVKADLASAPVRPRHGPGVRVRGQPEHNRQPGPRGRDAARLPPLQGSLGQ